MMNIIVIVNFLTFFTSSTVVAFIIPTTTKNTCFTSSATTTLSITNENPINHQKINNLFPKKKKTLLYAEDEQMSITATTTTPPTTETTTTSENNSNTLEKVDDEEDDEDEDEYELIEYETLSEPDLYNSEWKVGTNWNKAKNRDDIKVTWVRLVIDPKNMKKNIAIWGDGAQGLWKLDERAQFLTVSKETFGGWFGKKIWAGPINDYYFMQGTVRGWNPISPASVLGQWQMIRLGVEKEEAGAAPWFEEEEEEGLEVSDKGEELD